MVALVCAVGAGLVGSGELGGQTADAGRTRRSGIAAPSGLAPARAVGLEPGQRDGALASRGQKLVYSSLAPHSIQLGCAVSICVLTSGGVWRKTTTIISCGACGRLNDATP